jgi:hypothetical protein
MSLIIFYPFAMPWECDYASAGDTRLFDKNSDQTVMRQWCNSDAFSLSTFLTFAMFWDVIDCIISFINALGAFHKNSVETVMEQWCNSDRTVMPLIWAPFMSFSSFSSVIDHISSFHSTLGECLLIWWWNKTFWQKQWSNSDETVMRQWSNSDAFDLGSFMSFARFWDVIDHILIFCNALGCVWWHKTIWKKTVIKKWWDSDGTVIVIEQWCIRFKQF